ncbi:unnamed protein product [Ceratitis capitata]|uniref:(Mediterranean fruit fly) hypothetical protein n=1 Tax=Ceratitis capitata TaxID=7213 RepID=A0A811UJ64_CERCA|nr:unnamed protein product [Ceratitis capitata]
MSSVTGAGGRLPKVASILLAIVTQASFIAVAIGDALMIESTITTTTGKIITSCLLYYCIWRLTVEDHARASAFAESTSLCNWTLLLYVVGCSAVLKFAFLLLLLNTKTFYSSHDAAALV